MLQQLNVVGTHANPHRVKGKSGYFEQRIF